MNVAEVARIWQASGVSVIPILANQTKRPAIRWSPYIATAPTLDEVHDWWGNGKTWGLALICGGVSGGLEMCEIEGRALDGRSMTEVMNRMDETGARHIWELLSGPEGFTETSPSGGLHFLYRISDHEVPGNTKIAQKARDEEGNRLCLVETRGHGGYVITAPTSGICHPSGEAWQLLQGQYGKLPVITWQERNLFHQALQLALDESPAPVAVPTMSSVQTLVPVSATTATSVSSLSPGDDFEARVDWHDILAPTGWRVSHKGPGNERHWTRPGKEMRDGTSATTGRANDRDRLYVFSTSTEFEAEVPYTKFGAYALLNHGGDHHAAAQTLARLGYGERPAVVTIDEVVFHRAEAVAGEPVEHYTLDDVGNGMRFKRCIEGRYRWLYDEKKWYLWDGVRWVPDHDDAIVREYMEMTEAMAAEALANGDKVLAKWAKTSRNAGRINAGISLAKAMKMAYSSADWGPNRHLLNLPNGTMDLHSGELLEHDKGNLQVQLAGAEFEPEAQCPRFEEFMEAAIPEQGMRSYVQRALGYSMLGDADQRALFVLYGPSGTGKSTLIETMQHVFGTYGTTAQAGTFRSIKNEKTPTNDLHELRGRRFVTSSETAEGANFDEELLKRLTGRDSVRSRALYQESQEWVPECTLWLATNNAPRFNSDDNAIWSRVKLIPLTTVFLGQDQVFDYARTVLAPEAAGIFNWLLEGLRQFLAHGLGEPTQLTQLTADHRVSSDSVARFVADKLADGSYVESGRIKANDIYLGYAEWCRQVGERSLGSRRFMFRMESAMPQYTKIRDESGTWVYQGLSRPATQWLQSVS
jgi:P4 family phage/plasmid primase-like protien